MLVQPVVYVLGFCVAIGGALLWNQPLPPMVVHLNQLVAVIGWGTVLCLMPAPQISRQALRNVAPLLAVLAVLSTACGLSWAGGRYSQSPALPTLALLGLAAVLVVHGAGCAGRSDAAFRPFSGALAIAALGSSIVAAIQVLVPELGSNAIVAASAISGRAVGNVGQPNQLADSLLWGLAALVPLAHIPGSHRRAVCYAAVAVGLLALEGIVLSGSRTGFVGLVLLAMWGFFDRGLNSGCRRALIAAPLLAAALWLVTSTYSSYSGNLPDSLIRSAVGDITASRLDIWRDALALIAAQPWSGAGWGQFNWAWTLTPFSYRPAGFVDHAHNLLLHFAVELGVPCTALIVALLAAAAWRAWKGVRRLPGESGVCARAALIMVAVVGLHSMLEYPLWYAYFLLPTAWAWGFALGVAARCAPAANASPAPQAPQLGGLAGALREPNTAVAARRWRLVGGVFLAGGLSAWMDYANIVALHRPESKGPGLEQLRRGQLSPLFSRHADYLLAIRARPALSVLPEIERSAHVGLDSHVLFAWAHALQQRGELDKARYLAARMREFKRPELQSFFAPCADATLAPKPFQCEPPSASLSWRDFD